MGIRQKQNFLDGLARIDNQLKEFDLPLARYVSRYKRNAILFSKSGRTGSFFTEDSKKYLTPDEYRRLKRGERIVRLIERLDSLQARAFEGTRIYADTQRSFILPIKLKRSYAEFRAHALGLVHESTQKLTLVRVWNLSIVGAVIFGMLTMTMIYNYLGQGVSAAILQTDQQAKTQAIQEATQEQSQMEETAIANASQELNDHIDMDSVTSLLSEQSAKQDLEKEITEMVKGYPIEKMVPEIAKHDRVVAAFIIGIARQESGWGVHVPVYDGHDCYNYWGYRGFNPVGTGGHTCFASPQEAVDTVAKRIQFLVDNNKLNTPEKMIVWKCGDCSWDNRNDMQIWINSVSTYFDKLNASEKIATN